MHASEFHSFHVKVAIALAVLFFLNTDGWCVDYMEWQVVPNRKNVTSQELQIEPSLHTMPSKNHMQWHYIAIAIVTCKSTYSYSILL